MYIIGDLPTGGFRPSRVYTHYLVFYNYRRALFHTINKNEIAMWQGVGVEFVAQRKFLFLFPRQYIMSLCDPIFTFALHKNTLKVPTKPTRLI